MDSLAAIKEIRDLTGLSIGDIKKALEEAGGDKQKALELLKTRGASIADKKADRSTGEGVVASYIHANKKVGVLVEVLCETDFVARNPMFSELAHEVALHIAAMDPQSPEELLTQPFVKDPSSTIQEVLNGYIAKLGENIRLGKFTRQAI